jgi:hypothetical protein
MEASFSARDAGSSSFVKASQYLKGILRDPIRLVLESGVLLLRQSSLHRPATPSRPHILDRVFLARSCSSPLSCASSERHPQHCLAQLRRIHRHLLGSAPREPLVLVVLGVTQRQVSGHLTLTSRNTAACVLVLLLLPIWSSRGTGTSAPRPLRHPISPEVLSSWAPSSWSQQPDVHVESAFSVS